MDRFVKNFIALSIAYLALASVLGVWMLADPDNAIRYKFAHSHMMLLGWVSMMIYGVGYHVLPRFVGRTLKHRTMAEAQFWFANIGLLGMVVFYTMLEYRPGDQGYRTMLAVSGLLEAASMFMFFYNMVVTLFASEEAAP